MNNPTKDTQIAIAAARLIIDGRDPPRDHASILVTLEGLVSLVLLAVMQNHADSATSMLNEGLVPGVEARIALAASRKL